jgi:ribosomal protein L33
MTSSKKKTTTNKRKSPKKLDLQNLNSEASKEVKHREIESPTFISMANSFLIREQDPSFEKCY